MSIVRRAVGAVGALSLATSLAGCAHDSSADPDAVVPASKALPTAPAQPLVCGMLDESSVRAALGDLTWEVQDPGPDADPDHRLVSRQCTLTARADGRELLKVTVVRHEGTDRQGVLDEIRGSRSDYAFPASLGPGVASRFASPGPHDSSTRAAGALVLWGDYRVGLQVLSSAHGRDPLPDAVAMTQQVIAALKLPREPPTPYPSVPPLGAGA